MGDALQNALMQSMQSQSNENVEEKTDNNANSNSNSNYANANGNDLMQSIMGALNGGNNNANVDENAVTTLVNLGYTRQQAVNALTVCGGNVEMAASYLFSNS